MQVWYESSRIQLVGGRPTPRVVAHAEPYCCAVQVLSVVDGPHRDDDPQVRACVCLQHARAALVGRTA